MSTHTKIGIPHEKAPVILQMEVKMLIRLFLNVVANLAIVYI